MSSLDRAKLKNQTFMRVAQEIAGLGTCDRKLVGAVLVKDGRCISWGFNGAPPGAPHCNIVNHGYKPGEKFIGGCLNVTHAEANALAFAARQGISTDTCTLYVTVSPCEVCARLLVAAGVRRVFYLEEYRLTEGIHILQAANVIVLKVSE